jgi:hypothetical protein
MSLLVIGSVAFDDLETPFGKRENVLGGSATHCSLAASRFHHVRLVAVVGEDFGPEQDAVFEGRPIDLEGLVRVPGLSFHWKGQYGEDLNEARTLRTDLNAFAGFKPDLPLPWRTTPHLFLGNIDPVLQLDVVRQMAARPAWIALDTMNFWIEGARAALLAVLHEIDILLVNEAEVRSLTGERNLHRAYGRIRPLGPRILVVKRGEYGVTVFTPDSVFALPAVPLPDVLDPTGAGDTFAGGFLGCLAASGDLEPATLKRAAVAGTLLASFAVQSFGTERMQALTEPEYQARRQEFEAMLRI